jgi:hypothetical protein
MRSKLLPRRGEIEFLQPAIGRVPGRHSGVIAEQSCSIILLKDLPRRTRGTTKVHGDSSMLADRDMTSRIGSPAGLALVRDRESSSVMLRLLRVSQQRTSARHWRRRGVRPALMPGEPVRPVPVRRPLLAQRPQRKNEIAEQISHLRCGLGPAVGALPPSRAAARKAAPRSSAPSREISAISLTQRSPC